MPMLQLTKQQKGKNFNVKFAWRSSIGQVSTNHVRHVHCFYSLKKNNLKVKPTFLKNILS